MASLPPTRIVGGQPIDDGHEAEHAFVTRIVNDGDMALGHAYMQDHPEELQAYMQANPPPPPPSSHPLLKQIIDFTKQKDLPTQEEKGRAIGAGVEAQAIEGRDPALQQPMIDPTFVAPDVLGGPAAVAANIGSQAAAGLGAQAAGKAGAGPAVQIAAGLAAGALAGHLAGKAANIGAGGTEAPAQPTDQGGPTSVAGEAPKATAPIPLEAGQAIKPPSPLGPANVQASPITLTRQQASYIPIGGGAVTPQMAAQQLAAKQAAALKAFKVGERVAKEAGKPELATKISEAETMAKGRAQGLTMQQLGQRGIQEPELAAQTTALTQTVHDETRSLRGEAKSLLTRQAAGEDVTAEKDAWLNRVSALAPQAARVGGQRSAVARSLQILDPLKPENQMISAVNRFALDAKDTATPDELMQLFVKTTSAKTIAANLGKMSEAIENGGSIRGALSEYYMNALLSKPRTTIKKGMGDLISTSLAIPTRSIAARMPGATVEPGEASAMLYGGIHSFKDALRMAGETWKNQGNSALDEAIGKQLGSGSEFMRTRGFTSQGTRFEGTPIGKGIDLMGNVIRLPSRGIASVNDFAGTINYRMQLHALAFRNAVQEATTRGLEGGEAGDYIAQRAAELAQDPPSAMIEGARAFKNEQTYSSPLGPAAEKFNQWLDALPAGLGRLAFPFRRVPVNLYKFAIGNSPLAIATKSFWNAVNGGGAERDLALAKLGLGTMTSLMIGKEVLDGNITGKGPSDPKLRADLMNTGWRPYSIKAGDSYYSYGSLEPVGMPLGILADFHDVMAEAPRADAEHMGVAFAVAMGRNMSRQSYVQTAINFSSLMDDLRSGNDMPSTLAKFGAKEISGVIPQFVQGEARREDPVWRDARGALDVIREKIPGYSESVPPHLDLDGKPMPVPPGFLANEVYPFSIGQEKHDPVADEIYKTAAQVQKPPTILPGSGGRAPRFGDQPGDPDVGVNLLPQEQVTWQQLRASIKDPDYGTMREALEAAIQDPDYQGASQMDKAKALERIITGYGHAASQQLLADSPSLQARLISRQKYKALAHLPPGANPNDFLREAGMGG